jgi:antitoxin component YwqK of YwqJK toxin-antitoxin module
MKITIIILLLFSLNLKAQQLSHQKEKIINDSTVSKSEYYLINFVDTLYRVKVFVNENLYCETYSTDLFWSVSRKGYTHYYYKTGEIEWEGFCKEGFPHGEWVKFHQNGKIKSIINYYLNALKGTYTEYFEDGKIKTRGKYDYYEAPIYSYFYSCKIGQWEYYYSNGKIKSIENYWDGPPFEQEIINIEDYIIEPGIASNEYFEKVRLLPNGTFDDSKYKRNVKHGVWNYWNEEGELEKRETYKKGKLSKHNGDK